MELRIMKVLDYGHGQVEVVETPVFEGSLKQLLAQYPPEQLHVGQEVLQDEPHDSAQATTNPLASYPLDAERNESQRDILVSYRFEEYIDGQWVVLDDDPRRAVLFR